MRSAIHSPAAPQAAAAPVRAGGADPLHASPRQVAQRVQITAAFGPAAQLQGGLEDDEALLQARPAPRSDGLPAQLRAGAEALSGLDLSDVRVHRNSDKPAQLNALAYAQGTDIHLAPGQEQHLPHEAWHVVQQAQGRVAPTRQMRGNVDVNDDAGLEREADVMGAAAATGQRAGTDRQDPPSDPPLPAMAAGTVQRRVGFELEDRDWRAYIGEKKKDIRPALRQELLYSGAGFDLEADDSTGKTTPSLEFVTVPFAPTNEGIAALDLAFHQIRSITASIGASAPIHNPFEVSGEKAAKPKAKNFLTHDKHGLNPALLLAGGKTDARFKMQATQGVSLEDLPLVMQTFGSNAPGETTDDKAEREPARKLMYGEKMQATRGDLAASNLLAAAPSLAMQVVDALRATLSQSPQESSTKRKEPQPEQGKDPWANTSRLVGFLSAVMLYVKLLSTLNPGGKQAKYMIPLLARTSFPTLFSLLPVEQQDLLRAHFDVLVHAVVEVANRQPFISSVVFVEGNTEAIVHQDIDFAANRALVRHKDFGLGELSLGGWLHGVVVDGIELLNPVTIARALSEPSKTASDALESFAVLGRATQDPSTITDKPDIEGHSDLGIFENRMIGGPNGFFTATQAHAAALSYLTFYKNLNAGGGKPGAFPNLAAPDLPLVGAKDKKGKKDKKEKKEKK